MTPAPRPSGAVTLTPLDRPVRFLREVGPKRGESLQRMGILTARDLLYHVPRRYDDASTITPVALAQVGMDVTVVGEVRNKGVIPTRAGLRIFQAVIADDSGVVTCSWPGQPWLDRILKRGDRLLVTGPVKFFHGKQIQPREQTVLSRDGAPAASGASGRSGAIFSVYPASEDVPQWVLRRIVDVNLEKLLGQARADEFLPREERVELGLVELSVALRELHRPRSQDRIEEARRRLAFDELFFLQLLQARVRHEAALDRPGIAHRRTNRLVRALYRSLPFRLTSAQIRVLQEISSDLTSPKRMNRLLQGDVGCGKTLVALFSMLIAVEGGSQAALMAPTEILAEQHARRIRELLGKAGAPRGMQCTVEILVGSATGRRRKQARARVASGAANLVVGTHALIQEGVEFDALGLVVVDEQHRFGVRQRMALSEREIRPDTLLMSATPIPRSLAMTLHGDLDLSVIDELPPGRRPVDTRVVAPEERADAYREVARRLDRGRQAYLVFPAIEESDQGGLLAAETEFERLRGEDLAGRRLALLHGRMPSDEKDRVMRAFQRGDIDVLVATTVVEVGIDVPNATVMVIENAERFGLSQLHQLRGRIGRGGERGLCFAVAGGPSSAAGGGGGESLGAGGRGAAAFGSPPPAESRLAVFADTTDGFKIAAEDLRIRGQGDFFGAEQHGHRTELRFAELLRDGDLVQAARERGRGLIEADPGLSGERHARLRAELDRRYGERAKMFGVG